VTAFKFGSGRGAIRSICMTVLIVFAVLRGERKLADKLAGRM
jgi:hypothetical protein